MGIRKERRLSSISAAAEVLRVQVPTRFSNIHQSITSHLSSASTHVESGFVKDNQNVQTTMNDNINIDMNLQSAAQGELSHPTTNIDTVQDEEVAVVVVRSLMVGNL